MKKYSYLASLLVFCSIVGVSFAVYRHYDHFPEGPLTARLSAFRLALMEYADEHGGWYPKDAPSPLECLQQLYPKHCRGAGEDLAGLSGNESRTVSLLREHKALDAEASSWVYWPGFGKSDDESLAIIWERGEGLFTVGAPANGHAVFMARGGYKYIPVAEWPKFLKNQEALRQRVLAKRPVRAAQK